MHFISKLMLAAVATAALVAGGPAFAQQKLKWAHVYESSEPYHTESVWAAAEIKKRTNGKFDIEVFPASTLGKETDINQGLALGTVDMIISGPSFAARSYPRLGIAYYPFIFRDADHLLAYSKSPIFAEMVEEFRKKTGIQILAYTYYGARKTTAQKPFTDCAGMKGLKIRVPDVPAYMATPKACGANPTPIAFAEVYLALQNGTVDAQENPLTTIEAKKFYEVHKDRPFYGELVGQMTAEPVVVQVLEGENAVAKYRAVMGATNPKEATEGTIRKLFALSIGENSVHGSDSLENARIEIAQFFTADQIVG